MAFRETEPLTSAETSSRKHGAAATTASRAANSSTELDESPPLLASELEAQSPTSASSSASLSWKERAKTFAIEYGRVGVCTHIVLSLVSYSAIYVGVSTGVDVTSLLDSVGFSVSTSESTTNSAGSAVIAYAMYKLLAPVRWPLTFAVTPVVMRALRRRGYMLPAAPAPAPARRSPPPPSSSSEL